MRVHLYDVQLLCVYNPALYCCRTNKIIIIIPHFPVPQFQLRRPPVGRTTKKSEELQSMKSKVSSSHCFPMPEMSRRLAEAQRPGISVSIHSTPHRSLLRCRHRAMSVYRQSKSRLALATVCHGALNKQ